MKIDLHVHSKHSDRPSQWILKKIGCPESFTEPRQVYDMARNKGMGLVTISDHNCINGALEIAHLDGVFVSEEVTAHFPEDGCKVHVLAWDINEAIHEDLQKVRRNIYDLAAYLHQNNIAHGLAHPLFAVNDKLTLDHFEKLLLLFKNFEINGTRDGLQNNILKLILDRLTPDIVFDLADRHDMAPLPAEPWIKHLTGGSDDHSGLNIADTHTRVPGASCKDTFFQGLAQGCSLPGGEYSTPKAMARTLYSIGYQFFRKKKNLGRFVNKDRFLKFLDRSLMAESPDDKSLGARVKAMIHQSGILKRKKKEPREVHAVLRAKGEEVFYETPDLADKKNFRRAAPGLAADKWFDYANTVADRVLKHYSDILLRAATGSNPFSIFQTIASAGAFYTALTPFFVGYSVFTKDRGFCRKALARFQHLSGDPAPARRTSKLAHFTDTFFETNGVAVTLRDQVRLAKQLGREYTIVTCTEAGERLQPGVRNFTPTGMFDLPEYPELALYYPPFLKMMDYVYEHDFTHLHAATPGPIGLAGLLVSKILKLPIAGTYHTALPQYARYLTGDDAMEDLMWSFMTWFYNQMDEVYVPSKAMGQELASKGIHQHKIQLYPRGIDIDLFTPGKRNGFFKKYNLNGNLKILYVGRISKEKNLPLLEQVLRDVVRDSPVQTDIVLVGDGPYREEMQNNLRGMNCLFTGKLDGEDLAQAYASCDLLVFPSTTDTFGRVVLEAQASGLPVVVTDKGGPQENLLPGKTGLVVRAHDPGALKQAVLSLIKDREKLRQMGAQARQYMENRSSAKAFDQAYEQYVAYTRQ